MQDNAARDRPERIWTLLFIHPPKQQDFTLQQWKPTSHTPHPNLARSAHHLPKHAGSLQLGCFYGAVKRRSVWDQGRFSKPSPISASFPLKTLLLTLSINNQCQGDMCCVLFARCALPASAGETLNATYKRCGLSRLLLSTSECALLCSRFTTRK